MMTTYLKSRCIQPVTRWVRIFYRRQLLHPCADACLLSPVRAASSARESTVARCTVHFCSVSRRSKRQRRAGCWLPGPRGRGGGQCGATANGPTALFWGDERVLEPDRGGRFSEWVVLCPVNHPSKNPGEVLSEGLAPGGRGSEGLGEGALQALL